MNRMKKLEAENARLKKMYADVQRLFDQRDMLPV